MRRSLCATLLILLVGVSGAENHSSVALDTSETLFSVLTAINTCGYDQELGGSDPLRSKVRSAVARARQNVPGADEATQAMCQYYEEHRPPDNSRVLSEYVSLALYLNPAPNLTAKVKDADLPPDAVAVLGILPLLQKFYEKAGLHGIWEDNLQAISALTDRYHEALAKMLFDTEIYLKLPSASRLGREFTVYVDPMGAPGQANARNYGSDYYVVISPGPGASLKMEQIRHTYLHYLLDPLALKYPAAIKRLEPLQAAVKAAPMDEGFKSDMSLLVTECFIRAIEARMAGSGKASETERLKLVDSSGDQGFILTAYFYEALARFEKDPAGLREAYGDLVNNIDVRKEQKRASQITFASTSTPELLQLSQPKSNLLVTAEQRLSAGDSAAAQKLAQQALEEKNEDPGRALFILAEVATHNSDMQGARNYFERAIQVAHEPKVVAWSHIYLGRIFDLQADRAAALDHYRAAETAGTGLPEAKAAAEQGLQQPYEPPGHPQ
ncbi:MAG TPA: tetratricopeptide repeat protein [Terriglobales bacterium]|nr:tetratricopeptide repeat protein [Terriglobales bacterium]